MIPRQWFSLSESHFSHTDIFIFKITLYKVLFSSHSTGLSWQSKTTHPNPAQTKAYGIEWIFIELRGFVKILYFP